MPKRSNQQTDERQAKAAHRYAVARRVHLERAPGGTFGRVDYVAKESSAMGAAIVSVIEMKCRDCKHDEFTSVWAEVRKVQALRHWSRIYDAPGLFVVEWTDGVMREVEAEALVEMSYGPMTVRRTDRDDELDMDDVYKVPIQRMTEVRTAEEPT